MLHKPRIVDLALSLALMQAEVLDSQSKTYNQRHHQDFNKYNAKPTIVTQPGILGNPPPEEAKPKWEVKLANLRA